MFKIGVFAVILNQNEHVLLCHRRDHDLWNLPGGGLESGEAPWEGVIREVKEETGLDVAVVQLTGVYSKPAQDEVVFNFICQVIGGELKTTNEADKFRYFALSELPKNTVPKQVERIQDALNQSPAPALKAQTGPSTLELLQKGQL